MLIASQRNGDCPETLIILNRGIKIGETAGSLYHHTPMSDLSTLQKVFKGDLVTPEHPDYGDAINRWARNATRRAKVVAFVKDANDVALALQYAKINDVPIAIRSGGHSSAGTSSVEDGLVIDLSRYLNLVTVDAEKRLAYIGGGTLWRTVDYSCIQHGLAAVAGTVNHVSLLLS